MKSPFPGMDPYLENHWRDVHAALISAARAALNRTLPDGLVARIEERVVIDSFEFEKPKATYPDARVFEDPEAYGEGPDDLGGATAIAEPIVLDCEVEEHTETYLEILDAASGGLVAVLEVLSPTNKLPGEGHKQYRQKRHEFVTAGAGFIEIDLIRQGSWRQLLSPTVAPARVKAAYRATVRRGERGTASRRVELYPLPLRRRLLIIPVPLREGEADAPLDLQQLVDTVYREGRYGRSLYERPLHPPLSKADAEWAAERIG